MPEHVSNLGGLQTTIVHAPGAECADVVLLHGHAMQPSALAPFAHALRLPARFLLPQAPHPSDSGGYSWWPVDAAHRRAALASGPRDLAETYPPGRNAARGHLQQFLQAARSNVPPRPLLVWGFSQGGMLACDSLLLADLRVDALALLSACRIAVTEWLPHRQKLRDLPVLVAHGRQDDDLAFVAGEALRDFLIASGANVTWMPFDAGHVIPLPVWRKLKRMVEQFV